MFVCVCDCAFRAVRPGRRSGGDSAAVTVKGLGAVRPRDSRCSLRPYNPAVALWCNCPLGSAASLSVLPLWALAPDPSFLLSSLECPNFCFIHLKGKGLERGGGESIHWFIPK